MRQRSLLETIVVVASIVCVNSAQAGAQLGSWYLAPKLVYVDPDNIQRYVVSPVESYKVDNAFGGSFGLGKVLNENWDAGFSYLRSTHKAGPGSTSYEGIEVVINRVFRREKSINPFIGIGLNNTRYSLTTVKSATQSPSERGTGILVKTGLLTDVNSIPWINKIPFVKTINKEGSFQLVTELGWRADGVLKNCDGGTNPCAIAGNPTYLQNSFFSLGLHYNFGKHAESKPEPVVVAAPVVQEPPLPLETATPAPPADTDSDGVIDPSDRCANTPSGDKVDTYGCSLTMSLEVQFDPDKETIKPEYNPKLDEFVQFLKDVPSVKGVLEGHTDNVGDKLANQKLSERRAEAVKAYVVSRDIDAARLVTKGYGDFKPIADNATAEGRAANRRVQFTH